MWTPSPEEWTFFGSIAGLLGTGLGAAVRFDKRTKKVEQTTETLRPNGGSSLNDAIRRMEADGTRERAEQARVLESIDRKQDSQCDLIARLTGRFEQHLHEVEVSTARWEEWRRSVERSGSQPQPPSTPQ